MADSPHDFETASGAFASGVTLVTIADGREDIGVTVSAFCSVSTSPPLILISLIAHPPEVLDSSNAQHRRLLAAIRRRDEAAAAREMTEHLRGTEHVLVGLLPKT